MEAMPRESYTPVRQGMPGTRPAIFFRGARSTSKASGSFTSPSQRPSFDPLRIQGCFNCDDRSHNIRDCPQPINAAKYASNKLGYFQNRKNMGDRAVHLVLAHLCQQVDGSSLSVTDEVEDEEDVFEEETDREIFECILRESNELGVNFTSERGVPIAEKRTTTYASQRLIPQEEGEDGLVFVVYDREEASIVKCEHGSGRIAQIEFGACVDAGAQKSVIGKQPAPAYFRYIGEEFRPILQNRPARFKFGNRRHVGIGCVQIRIPINESHVLCPCIAVVDVDVPLLLGLDFLDEYKMNVNSANDMLDLESHLWSLPLTRKMGHLYLE